MSPVLAIPALALLLLPGVVIAIALDDRREDPLLALAAAALGGVAVWTVAFWFLRYVPLRLEGLVASLSAAAVIAIVLLRRRFYRAARSLRMEPAHQLALGALLATAVLRFAPLAMAPVAPGADMSMHSYMTRLILEARGVPSSYQPVLPIDEFGSYAAGLPTLGALSSLLTGTDAATGAFLAACFAHLVVGLSVYAYVRSRAGPGASAVAMLLATVGTRDPQYHFVWGGNPTVLSLALVTFGLLLIERLETPAWRRALVPAALVLAAAPMTHAVLPFALVYALPPLLALRLWQRPGLRMQLLGRGIGVAALALLLSLPYLLHLSPTIGPEEMAWIERWQRLPEHVPSGPAWLLPLSIPQYLVDRLGAFFAVWLAAGLVIRRWVRCASIAEELFFSLLLLLLVLNARVWILPGSFALYPDRITLLLVPVTARMLASSIEAAFAAWGRRSPVRVVGLFVAMSGLIPAAGTWYLRGVEDVSVTRDDLAAIAWIEQNTPEDAVVANNYGDAGIWIPALALRAVSNPHVNVIYLDEVRAWARETPPSYVFIGAKRVYREEEPWSRPALLQQPGHFREVFRRGGASVFEIIRE